MIARIWKGVVAAEDADDYAEYMRSTGLPGYTDAYGNVAAFMLRRDTGSASEFTMVSLWESMDAIRGFAGEDADRAVFYPEDDRYLIARDEHVTHHTVAAASWTPPTEP